MNYPRHEYAKKIMFHHRNSYYESQKKIKIWAEVHPAK